MEVSVLYLGERYQYLAPLNRHRLGGGEDDLPFRIVLDHRHRQDRNGEDRRPGKAPAPVRSPRRARLAALSRVVPGYPLPKTADEQRQRREKAYPHKSVDKEGAVVYAGSYHGNKPADPRYDAPRQQKLSDDNGLVADRDRERGAKQRLYRFSGHRFGRPVNGDRADSNDGKARREPYQAEQKVRAEYALAGEDEFRGVQEYHRQRVQQQGPKQQRVHAGGKRFGPQRPFLKEFPRKTPQKKDMQDSQKYGKRQRPSVKEAAVYKRGRSPQHGDDEGNGRAGGASPEGKQLSPLPPPPLFFHRDGPEQGREYPRYR